MHNNYIRLIIVLLVLNWQTLGFSEEMPEVYIYKIENGSVHLKESPEKEIRRMELLPNGSQIIVEDAAIAYLTCPGCNIEKITRQESPYRVDAGKIKKNDASPAKILSYFTSALKEFVYPDSKIGRRVSMHVRGGEKDPDNDICNSLVPQNHENILPIGESILFRWALPGDNYTFQIINISSTKVIYKQNTNKRVLEVPFENFAEGYVYHWMVETKGNASKCSASFSMLSGQEAEEIKNNMAAVINLLPPDIDDDTKLRIKAGYLLSEGFVYDAKKLLTSK